ncbi:M20/M25/M40 family metallo-hydrolase [Brevibacillus dissolubilis]|uniref:M20/M25/M40 family metallo-hydrolase n=1 Tax=Brevibacillus dissolubilis TaxID=1844116 RepID=UPI002100210F|nr:M20/M25/M40 family metallo-hydrolase [Brevibacillus dissolubilis]
MPIYENPVQILQDLIRFDTTNPPGHEKACIQYIQGLLHDAGIETTIVAKDPERPNLIARLKGNGSQPPLLLYGHVDVVGTQDQKWTHPPFAAEIHDGFVWGRGALDMKGGVAMMLAAFLRAHAEQISLSGDIILAIVSDEEAGGEYGAKYLVEEHPHLFQGVRHAIGEFGGFSLQVNNQRFYPIMIAEKQLCWVRAKIRGTGGHGSLGKKDGSIGQLASFLTKMNEARLPVHITPAAKLMIESMASHLPFPASFLLRQLLNPALTDPILKLMGEKGATFEPLLRNTVTVTIIRGGEKINVVPSEIIVEMDGRLLPGFTPEQFYDELRAVIGQQAEMIEFELIRYDPVPSEPDMGLFPKLADQLRQADPEGIPVPMLLPAGTDGRYFSRIGIQTYGFLPMNLPESMKFTSLIHAADERIPVEAVHFGADALYRVLRG